MHRSFIIVLSTVVLGVLLAGCFQEATRDMGCLTGSGGEKIRVTTKDGFRYWFVGGEYSVAVDSTGSKVLIGTGRRDRGDNKSSEKFTGTLPFASIDRVIVAETSPWLWFAVGVLSGITLFAVVLLLSFSGFRMG